MAPSINIIKGIHPGIILDRELKRRSIAKGRFAISINEFPQTIGAVIKGKRGINPSLSLKIEKELDFEEGYFMVLQAYYDIKVEKLKHNTTPNISKLRSALFWDTDINRINWMAYKESVVRRVFERGNEEEKEEITRFYTKSEVDKILKTSRQNNYIIHHNTTPKNES